MKTFALAVATATLLAGSAFAQGGGNLSAQQPMHGMQAPPYQQGSGQRAGGPANELNTNGPATTGTVIVPAQPAPGAVIMVDPAAPPATLDGKGNYSGGYSGEARRRDGLQ